MSNQWNEMKKDRSIYLFVQIRNDEETRSCFVQLFIVLWVGWRRNEEKTDQTDQVYSLIVLMTSKNEKNRSIFIFRSDEAPVQTHLTNGTDRVRVFPHERGNWAISIFAPGSSFFLLILTCFIDVLFSFVFSPMLVASRCPDRWSDRNGSRRLETIEWVAHQSFKNISHSISSHRIDSKLVERRIGPFTDQVIVAMSIFVHCSRGVLDSLLRLKTWRFLTMMIDRRKSEEKRRRRQFADWFRSFLVFTLDQHRQFRRLIQRVDRVLEKYRYPTYYEVCSFALCLAEPIFVSHSIRIPVFTSVSLIRPMQIERNSFLSNVK